MGGQLLQRMLKEVKLTYLPRSDVEETTGGVIKLDLKSLKLVWCSDEVHHLALSLAYRTHLHRNDK